MSATAAGRPTLREAWADFTAAEWAGGTVSLDFAVPAALALEAGADAPFDIRLHRLGNADISIDGVELTWLGEDEGEPAARPSRPVAPDSVASSSAQVQSGLLKPTDAIVEHLFDRCKCVDPDHGVPTVAARCRNNPRIVGSARSIAAGQSNHATS